MQIKNLKKAAKRILKAVKNKEKIILFGDVDLDGVSSIIILKETLMSLGAEDVIVYFPDRNKDGYGINKEALKSLSKQGKALFIALDCGITNFEEVKLAKKLGFEMMIIDHHQILSNKLPQASIIVDPLQKGDKYPFKRLATAGLVYKLVQEILGEKISQSLEESFLELVALATIADMMPREEDNQEFIAQGLIFLKKTLRPGLKVFWETDSNRDSSINELAQKIISTVNISEPAPENLNQAYLILTSPNESRAKEIIEKVLEQGRQKSIMIKEIAEEVEERISQKPEEPIIFEGDDSWQPFLIGAVASRIYNKHSKPIFIFCRKEKESQGSVRTPKDIDAVKLMTKCQKHLITFGGHARAAGFRLKNENLDKFKQCLIKNIKN